MSKALKDVCINFTKSIAGGYMATVIFAFCKELLAHHELGFPASLWASIFLYTFIYGFLFTLLHLHSTPTRLTTCVTAFFMVGVTCLISFADDLVSFTVWTAVGQFAFALLLTAFTGAFYWKTPPYGLGKS